MTDPTESHTLSEKRGPELRLNYPVQDTLQTYAGQFAALNTHGVATKGGTCAPYTGASGECMLGVFSDQAKGGDVGSSGENNVDGGGKILNSVSVTGVTDAATDVGKPVYLADSGLPFVLTPLAAESPAGVITKVHGAALADVWVFGIEAKFVLDLLAAATFAARVGNA